MTTPTWDYELSAPVLLTLSDTTYPATVEGRGEFLGGVLKYTVRFTHPEIGEQVIWALPDVLSPAEPEV